MVVRIEQAAKEEVAAFEAERRGRSGWPSHPAALAVAWLACLSILYAFVVARDYRLRDPDSTLYESISAQLSQRPVAEWMVPQFPPARFKEGRFVEHLAVLFWPAAALHRLGFSRGAVLANFAYWLLMVWSLFALTRALASKEAAWFAAFLFVISPLGIQYSVRANHEPAWGLCSLFGLVCLVQIRRSTWFGLGLIGAALGSFLIKGVLGLLFMPMALLVWLATLRRVRELLWLGASACVIGAAALAYEWAYLHATGHGFFSEYLGTQLGYVAQHEKASLLSKLANPAYYLAQAVWFALPGSVLAAWGLGRALREKRALTCAQRLAVFSGGGCVLLVSLMTRRAIRYIFPVLPFLHAPGAESFLARFPKAREWLRRREAALPYLLMAAILIIVGARILVNLRFVEIAMRTLLGFSIPP